jgi:hypothetical protein
MKKGILVLVGKGLETPGDAKPWLAVVVDLTPFFEIKERALNMGFGGKRSSKRQVNVPKLLGFPQALLRGHEIPLRPLGAFDFFGEGAAGGEVYFSFVSERLRGRGGDGRALGCGVDEVLWLRFDGCVRG